MKKESREKQIIKAQERIRRLKKLVEEIKSEEEDFIDKYGEDDINLVPVIYDKMDSHDYRYKKAENLLQPGKIIFPVYKYFIETPDNSHYINEKNLTPYTIFYKILEATIRKHFKKEDYVFIISDSSEHLKAERKALFKLFAKTKVGRLNYSDRVEELPRSYRLNSIKKISETIMEASAELTYNNVLVYKGSPVKDENIIILGDEFGFDDALGNLLIALKPKAVLNILHSGKYSFFDNVD